MINNNQASDFIPIFVVGPKRRSAIRYECDGTVGAAGEKERPPYKLINLTRKKVPPPSKFGTSRSG